jgi:adenylate cyclase
MDDRIVLIGSTATSLNDFFYTPYSGDRLITRQRTPGVEIQAHTISQILSTVLDGRPLIQTWTKPLEGLWILFWSFVGATLTWNWRYVSLSHKKPKRRNKITFPFSLSSFPRLLAPFLALGPLFGITYASFLNGWWIPIVPPVLAFSGSAIAITTYLAYTATKIRQTFGQYLSDSVVAEVLENPKGLQIGGENRILTLLASDLRGFTALSEQLSPQDVVKVLNIYLESMTDVITQYQGTIDDFLGDGILVFFGAPIPQENHPDQAVACAVAMQLAMNSVNQRIQQLGFPKLEMGIGINTGEVVLGNIGSTQRTKYSVIGQQVNLAFRLESYTVGGQILVSESTLKQVKQPLTIDGHQQIKPKGIKQALTIYEVRGIGGEYNLLLPQEAEIFFSLPEEICLEFHYALLDGKHITDSLFKGNLVKLSPKGALVRAENTEGYAVPEPLSNIKLTLLSPNHSSDTDHDIYAKVLKKSAEPRSFYIHFTAKSPTVAAKLEALYTQIKQIS